MRFPSSSSALFTLMLVESPALTFARLGNPTETRRTSAATSPNFSFNLTEVPWITFPGGGGRIREVDPSTITDSTMSAAYLELYPGGVRELHWHPFAAEWGYVTEGQCRLTLLDNEGRYDNGVANEGDIWYFPNGWGHSLQGNHPDSGCKMVLFFDEALKPTTNDLSPSGMFSVFPPKRIPESVKKTLPSKMVVVTQKSLPFPELPQSDNRLENWPVFTTKNGYLVDSGKGGYAYEVKRDKFPATQTMSGALMHLDADSLRDIHWHPNADEMQYILNGTIRVSVYCIQDVVETYEISAGDVGFVPQNCGHYIEPVDGPADFLLTFNSPSWQTQELTAWMAVTPPYITAATLNTTVEDVEEYFPKKDDLFLEPEDEAPATQKKSSDS